MRVLEAKRAEGTKAESYSEDGRPSAAAFIVATLADPVHRLDLDSGTNE